MKRKILPVLAIVWGALIVLGKLFGAAPQGSSSYQAGSWVGLVFGVALLVVGIRSLLKARKPDPSSQA